MLSDYLNLQTMKNRFYFFLDLGKLLRLVILLILLLAVTCSCSDLQPGCPPFAKVFAAGQPVKAVTSAGRRP